MKKLFSLVLLFLIIAGCSGRKDNIDLLPIIYSASEGNKSANDSISGLFPANIPPGTPSDIKIDTLILDGAKFFAVCVSFKDNISNRFAIYDENLNCFLIDKSINGSLNLQAVKETSFGYFTLEEDFFSSDSLEIKRLSLYRGDTSGFNLAFRTFTMMKTEDTIFVHTLYEITKDKVRTNITAPVFSGLNNFNEDYPYDLKKKIYDAPKSIYFDEFVSGFISSIEDTIHNFIKSAKSPKEKPISGVFENTGGNIPDFYLSLNENWRELRNKSGSGFLKKELTGSKFVNEKLKSDIYVFMLPFYEEAETYVNANLKYRVKGNYTVRYSDEYDSGEKIKKYFEYSCKTKKYLLILSALKDTYKNYKSEYFDIINTFYINC